MRAIRSSIPSKVTGAIAYCAIGLGVVTNGGCSSEDQVKPLKPLQVATGNWEPFVGEELPHNGPLAEMITTILGDSDYVPAFQFYGWPMVEKHLERGYPAIAFPFIESSERTDKGFLFIGPLHTFDYVLFYHKEREQEFNPIRSLKDIGEKGLKIGRIRGYAKLYDKKRSDNPIPDENYISVTDAATGFKMLRRSEEDDESREKKIDFLLESKTVGLEIIESQHVTQDKDEFMYLGQNGRGELISKVNLSIMVSPKLNKEIVKKIKDSIEDPKNKEFFDSLRTRTKTRSLDRAFLSASADKIIYGYKKRSSGRESFMIPRNTKVMVTEWGDVYTHEVENAGEQKDPGRSQVKLLSGPLKGKVLWINNQHLTLEN
ncbi:MAG: hypothetical protein AB2551_03160 [Candidatus Thiodiazotropha sp.]